MDGVRRSSNISPQCTDSAVNAAESGAGCAAAVVAWAAATPTGAGAVIGGIAAAVTCFATGWNGAKAFDQCAHDDWSAGIPPSRGEDGVDDHRNDPAEAAWRARVEIEPLNPGRTTELSGDSSD
jgi:hypothetical protein